MRAVLAAPPPTLLVIAKSPVPGRVKTRLTPPYRPEQAAALAEAALADTLRTLDTVPAGRRLLVLDGEPGSWLPPGWQVVPQVPGPLDERLAAAFAHAPAGAPALLVGMDTPQLRAGTLAAPLAPGARAGADAWFGPAADGGFWALGLARPCAQLAGRLLRGVPMSTGRTGAALLERLAAEGLTVRRLPELTDVDTAADAALVAALAPDGDFAACWRELAAASEGSGFSEGSGISGASGVAR
ncbi:TIGR04282 family arsenosugar biosynthesis glycosyltransferase [Kitasatospora nipponensis]|uniref:TIGR04282 family arsenosugar biosynthesis glycosyltransferase n=1 Tax=Kitasatospora nipponensis TaxID=258049 RepID=UPI0031E2211F